MWSKGSTVGKWQALARWEVGGEKPHPKGPSKDRVAKTHTHLLCGRCRPHPRHRHRCWPPQPPHPHIVCRACQGQEHSINGGQSLAGTA